MADEIITSAMEELNALVKKHPRHIPVAEVAEFLDMNAEGLKAALLNGTAPFGFAYKYAEDGNRVCVIPTLTFALWVTNGGKRWNT